MALYCKYFTTILSGEKKKKKWKEKVNDFLVYAISIQFIKGHEEIGESLSSIVSGMQKNCQAILLKLFQSLENQSVI